MKTTAILAASAILTASAHAQLVPDRAYYGVDRRVPMSVTIPENVEGEASIVLLRPVTAEEIASASVDAGRVDLAALFPIIWSPDGAPAMMYAQLVVGEEKVGPAVILQPMVSPKLARLTPQGEPSFVQMGDVYSGLRAYVEKYIEMETSEGTITFRMRPDEAPNTSWHIMRLVDDGFYTDIIFHRIFRGTGPSPFVIQAGDPTGTGAGGPGFMIDLEPSRLAHDFGVLSMARSQDPNTNGSQFFVALSRSGTSFLDGRYTSFAEAVTGGDVIRKIAATPVEGERPIGDPPRIISARLIDAPAYGEGPRPVSVADSEAGER